MRTILTILAVLLFAGWILIEMEVKHASGAAACGVAVSEVATSGAIASVANSHEWRRTAQGWEKIQDWKPMTPISVDLHPGIVGLFLLFVSLFSLIGFETPSPQKS